MTADILDELRDTTAGARSQVDGPTEISDVDQTEADKQLVTRFVNEVLVVGDYDRMPESATPDYAQHNPDVADGIAPLQAFAGESAMRYIELHKVVEHGDVIVEITPEHTWVTSGKF